MSSDPAIRVNGLSKCYHMYDKPRDRLMQMLARGRKRFYREFNALQDVSFEIQRGETVGIIGRNGSGKSTLLQVICGTLSPTAGEIEVNGKVAVLLELGAGFNPEFTGRENVFLNASLYGLTKEQINARFDEIMDFADIGEFIDQPVKTYSSGMFVRLAFAVIAHVDADILVIDEALAVGDVYFVQKCMRFLRSFTEQGTLLFVSHDTSVVVGLCSKALLMNRGKLERVGVPKDVSDYYLALLHGKKEPADIQEESILAADESVEQETFGSGNEADFGEGKANIVSVNLYDKSNNVITSIQGGEEVNLVVECVSNTRFDQPIVGFLVRDRLGQIIFGDNTSMSYQNAGIVIDKNQTAKVVFKFVMPILQYGDYSVTVAISQGTQEVHVQHHWIHNAIIIHARPELQSSGLISLNMLNVSFTVNCNE